MKTYCWRQNENDRDNKPMVRPFRKLFDISAE